MIVPSTVPGGHHALGRAHRAAGGQGHAALLEPFAVIVCTLTALVTSVTGPVDRSGTTALAAGATGVGLTSAAFGSAVGWFPDVLALAVVLFAYATMITWSCYGLQAWCYLLGHSAPAELAFKLLSRASWWWAPA